jgi:beta-galactosidase
MNASNEYDLNQGWSFALSWDEDPSGVVPAADQCEERVDLPHIPRLHQLNAEDMWVGECWYWRQIDLGKWSPGQRCYLEFEGVMQESWLYVDGVEVAHHRSGYLPLVVDITPWLVPGRNPVVAVRVSNRYNPDLAPGKPYKEQDFCLYSGMYRGARMRICNDLHITSPNLTGEFAAGGVFVRYPMVDDETAIVSIRTHVANAGHESRSCVVRCAIQGTEGSVCASLDAEEVILAPRSSCFVELDLMVRQPRLWSPDHPNLYVVEVVLSEKGREIDRVRERVGIRRIEATRSGGLKINGRASRLRGTNRHQDFPYVGNAVADAAHVRDARRIKESGFDYVRLSHYPQSPSFLDACDELGIVVMNAIPGWQFMGGEAFRENCCEHARHLIRRDRNHPSVFFWELSLNESDMPEAFATRLDRIGHEEFPGDQFLTCGWMDYYDIYLRARQHGGLHEYHNGEKALIVSEYGDWEYYACNEGFSQATGEGLKDQRMNSRKTRKDGDAGLLRKMLNFMEALNENLSTRSIASGQWAFCDHARGVSTELSTMGVRDFFRYPKFTHYFYRSQRDPGESTGTGTMEPMVFIASHWTESSPLCVYVLSNCETVALTLNGRPVARSSGPEAYPNLSHPPAIFELDRFEAGTLEATGYIRGRVVARHSVSTPGRASRLELSVDDQELPSTSGHADLLVVHGRILDDAGTVCALANPEIDLCVSGPGKRIGANPLYYEGGIFSFLVKTTGLPGVLVIDARIPGLGKTSIAYEILDAQAPRANKTQCLLETRRGMD